ncbi:unnamed protein product [Brassica napus]|uniref:(rape) hypothetical protein n=1 Tax=Brassica napus TaxID=3708 RepID=A0A816ISM9_BRANA|nr:unnamed protein product [Brassica napus]
MTNQQTLCQVPMRPPCSNPGLSSKKNNPSQTYLPNYICFASSPSIHRRCLQFHGIW